MFSLTSLRLTDTKLEGLRELGSGDWRRDRQQRCFSWAGEDRQDLERWGSRKGGMI